MTNFDYVSFLFIMLIIRDAILIGESYSCLSYIRHSLKLKCSYMNIAMFLILAINVSYMLFIDLNKSKERPLEFMLLSGLIYCVTTMINIEIRRDLWYLKDKKTNNKEDKVE